MFFLLNIYLTICPKFEEVGLVQKILVSSKLFTTARYLTMDYYP